MFGYGPEFLTEVPPQAGIAIGFSPNCLVIETATEPPLANSEDEELPLSSASFGENLAGALVFL